jgi:branched-chain amino acid transport system substrate-binding protein
MPIHRMISVIGAAFWVCALLTTAHAADIKIAVAGPMTGSTAAIGAQMKAGVTAAVDALNASGAFPGAKVKLVVADDACDPKQAVAVANRLVSDDVKLVVGHYCSSSSIPASDVYAEAGVIQISPGSTNPQLTERGLKTVFRVCGRDDQQGVIGADYILRHYKGKKIAVLDDKSTAGKGIADVVAARFSAGGVKDFMRASYTPGEKDYRALISRLKNERIEIAYIGGYYTEIGLIVRQAAEASAKLTIMGNDPLMTSEFWSIAGDAGDGTLFTFMPDPAKNASAAEAVARLKAANVTPEGFTLYAYAAVQAWANAAKRAGSLDAAKVVAMLRATPADTVIGAVQFDAKGDNAAPGFVVYRWHDKIAETIQ